MKFFPRWLAGLGVRDTSSKVGKRLLDGLTRKVASGHGILNFLSYETRERERERETMKRNNFKSIRKKEVSEKLGERPPP